MSLAGIRPPAIAGPDEEPRQQSDDVGPEDSTSSFDRNTQFDASFGRDHHGFNVVVLILVVRILSDPL